MRIEIKISVIHAPSHELVNSNLPLIMIAHLLLMLLYLVHSQTSTKNRMMERDGMTIYVMWYAPANVP